MLAGGADDEAMKLTADIFQREIRSVSIGEASVPRSDLAMRLVVVIPTLNRKSQLTRLLKHLERQHRKPDEIVVSAPDPMHVEHYETTHFVVSYIFGKKGSSAQRNRALDYALSRSDVVAFFDDDFLPADNYLALVMDRFAQHADWAVIMGRVIADGVQHEGLTFEEGLSILGSVEADLSEDRSVKDHIGAYGCNMSVRSRFIDELRFDERLVLHGWQEDIDFTSQLRQRGRVVQINNAHGVHLGLKTGRVSGVRFGYSQIANPVYLIRKGTVPARFGLNLMARNVAANVLKSLWPESYVDRRGRLRGNLLAMSHLLRGRVEPEYILKL